MYRSRVVRGWERRVCGRVGRDAPGCCVCCCQACQLWAAKPQAGRDARYYSSYMCMPRFRFVIRPRPVAILCCNDCRVPGPFPPRGRTARRGGPGRTLRPRRPRAQAHDRARRRALAHRPYNAHDTITRRVRAIARIRQRNLRGSHERPPARAPTLTRRPHDAIVIVRSAFTVFAPLPPPRPQFAIATARGTGRRVTYNAAPRRPGRGAGCAIPARVSLSGMTHQRLKPSKSGYSRDVENTPTRQHGKSHGQTELAHEETEDEGASTRAAPPLSSHRRARHHAHHFALRISPRDDR